MLITKNLMEEHQLILKYIELMERYANHPDTAVLSTHASRFIAFIQEFADNFHHAKEEDILFHYLSAPGVLTHCNPIPQMLDEHDKARNIVRTMEQAFAKNNLAVLVITLNQYASLLKEHIYKEDNILYPMAERCLSETAKSSIQKDYADAEQLFDSTAIWQHYQTLYTELTHILG
jgi:hemerythrin-like domain-containing protein